MSVVITSTNASLKPLAILRDKEDHIYVLVHLNHQIFLYHSIYPDGESHLSDKDDNQVPAWESYLMGNGDNAFIQIATIDEREYVQVSSTNWELKSNTGKVLHFTPSLDAIQFPDLEPNVTTRLTDANVDLKIYDDGEHVNWVISTDDGKEWFEGLGKNTFIQAGAIIKDDSNISIFAVHQRRNKITEIKFYPESRVWGMHQIWNVGDPNNQVEYLIGLPKQHKTYIEFVYRLFHAKDQKYWIVLHICLR